MATDGTEKTEYYFNTRTKMVEKGQQSPWEHVMGPYDTREEAANALELAEKRNQDWKDQEDQWEGEDS